MVTIRKRKVGKKEYFYLEHTMKAGKKVEKKELYLGSNIPKKKARYVLEINANLARKHGIKIGDGVKFTI